MAEQRLPRYQVEYPVSVGHLPGSSDDLEEAGRIYLATPGATDIWDRQERRFLDPVQEIDCVYASWLKWHESQVGVAEPEEER